MKRTLSVLIVLVILLGIVFIILKKPKENPVAEIPNIVGCYILQQDKNVYTLALQAQNGPSVAGTMHYDNFQFDDSSGVFVGNYENSILLGNYSFSSEGMNSVRQLIWKRSGNDFVEGSGDYTTVANKQIFVNPNSVTWNKDRTFVQSPCQS